MGPNNCIVSPADTYRLFPTVRDINKMPGSFGNNRLILGGPGIEELAGIANMKNLPVNTFNAF